MVAQKSHMEPVDAIVDALKRLEGSYAIAVLLEDALVAARDPYGFKPLVLGERDGTYYAASESCALDIVGAKLLRDVEPGEIVIINSRGMKSLRVRHERPSRCMHCSFEYVYTARPDSIIDGRSVYEARKEMGRRLALKAPCANADLVAGMPDSGTISAIGYAQAAHAPFEMAVVRNRYVGRTFIQPTQKVRELGVKIKLNPIEELFKDKRAVIVDDSIVRGTTAERIVTMIRNCGAGEVHLRIASPPVLHPCRYGIDTRKEETLAAVPHDARRALPQGRRRLARLPHGRRPRRGHRPPGGQALHGLLQRQISRKILRGELCWASSVTRNQELASQAATRGSKR